MDRPLKAVPDTLFHNIHRQYDKVVCSQFVQITHSTSRHHSASVLKTGLSEDAHFSKTTNDVGLYIKTETGKHQQYISNRFTLSLQKELNTFRNELFNAILAERISSERACHVSQLSKCRPSLSGSRISEAADLSNCCGSESVSGTVRGPRHISGDSSAGDDG